MEIKYPFEFNELLITDKVLDVLGFGEYWDGCGDFGERTFGKKKDDNTYEFAYRLIEHDESSDPECGYGYGKPMYSSCHYSEPFDGTCKRIYFLHELYENISERNPECLEYFVEKTKGKGVNMYPYIKSWIEFKHAQ